MSGPDKRGFCGRTPAATPDIGKWFGIKFLASPFRYSDWVGHAGRTGMLLAPPDHLKGEFPTRRLPNTRRTLPSLHSAQRNYLCKRNVNIKEHERGKFQLESLNCSNRSSSFTSPVHTQFTNLSYLSDRK